MSARGFFRDVPTERPALNRLPGERPPRIGRRETEFSKAVYEEVEDFVKDKPFVDIMLYNNTSDTYRERDPGDLYVSRAPYQVRPFSNTGITYDLDGPDGIRLGSNDPIEEPEYQRDSVRFRSAHRLCLPCRDMLNYYCKYRETRSSWDGAKRSFEEDRSDSVFPLSNAVVHHFNLLSMLAFVEIDECYLCTYLQQKIDHGFDVPAARLEEFRTECCWRQRNSDPTQGDTIYFVMYNPLQKKEAVWNYRHLLRLQLWPKEAFGHHFIWSLHDGSIDGDLLKSVSDDDFVCNDKPLTRALARTWYEHCEANEDGKHNECNKQHEGFLPSRLLDVQHAIKTSQLRLVSPDPGAPRFASVQYATLSHCWGTWGASMNPVLCGSNLKQRHEAGLDLSEVPQTFQDAVAVAHWFHIEWLWIDCLCIIQDSKEDWMREARMMDQVYRNAELNISSDFGDDSRSGLFVDRDYLAIAPLRIEATNAQKILYATPEITFKWMREARSLTRAWIHRERQLARRILHFTSKELVWECCGVEKSSFASESFPGGAPFERLFDGDTKFQSGRLGKSLAGDEETYGVWNDLCEGLSNKRVTHSTDMPIILSSLAKEFHQLLPKDEYLSGLWKSTLPHGLLWRTRSYGVDQHKVYADSQDQSYVAPSWSWLSVSVPVTLALRVPSFNVIPLATVDNAETRLSYDDPYGPIQFGALHMEGVLRQIQIDFNDDGRSFELSVIDEQLRGDGSEESSGRLRYVGSNWHEFNGDMCNLELDLRPETVPLRCYCLLTTIVEWAQDLDSNHRNISCLLLQPVENGSDVVSDEYGSGVYKRIGMLTLEDLYSLKMRYAVDDGGEENSNAEEEAIVNDEAMDEGSGGADDSGTARDHQPAITVDFQEVQAQDSVIAAELGQVICASVSTTTGSGRSSTSETNGPGRTSRDETSIAQDVEGDKHEEGLENNDDMEKVEDSDEKSQTEADMEDEEEMDIWDAHAFFLKRVRWRVISAAKEEAKRMKKDAVELDKEEQAEREHGYIDSDIHSNGDISEYVRETTGDQESEGISERQLEHSISSQTESVDGAIKDSDAAERSDRGEELVEDQVRSDNGETRPMNASEHAETAEDDEFVLGVDEAETSRFDYGALRSATTAWGRPLSPLEALYQFDDVLVIIQKDTGQFLWMKRLQTTKIVIL